MDLYFDLLPTELTRLILTKTLDEDSPWILRHHNIPAFTEVVYSTNFWKLAFEEVGLMPYVKEGLFNKDLMYLLEGIPFIVKKYSKYTSEEMFNIWDYEYTSTHTAIRQLRDIMSNDYLRVFFEDGYFEDLTILQDNIIPENTLEQFRYAMGVLPYVETSGGSYEFRPHGLLQITKNNQRYGIVSQF